HLNVHNERDELTNCDAGVVEMNHAFGAVPHEQADSSCSNDFSDGEIDRVIKYRPEVGLPMFLVNGFELPEFRFLAAENLHNVHPRDVFLDKGVEVSNGIADIVEGHLDLLLKDVS